MLSFALLVVLEPHVDLSPDAAGQQAVVVSNVLVRDMDVAIIEVLALGPVLGVGEPYLHLVDKGVFALLFDSALGFHELVGPDVVFGQRVVDDLQAHLDGHFIRRRAVLAQQKFEHEDRHVGSDLHLADEVFADHFAVKSHGQFLVQSVQRNRNRFCHGSAVFIYIPSRTGILLDLASTQSESGSRTTIST